MATTRTLKRTDLFGALTVGVLVAALAASAFSFWLKNSARTATENLLQDLALLAREHARETALIVQSEPEEPVLTQLELAQQELAEAGITADAETFIAAAAADDELIANLLLAAGTDPDVADDTGNTPLITAAAAGSVQLTDLLLGAGAQPERANALGKTALMTAAATGNLPIVKLLLKAGADVNTRDADGHSALIYAVQGGKAEAVDSFLRQRAEVDTVCCSGKNALIHALETRNSDITHRILDLQPQPLAWTAATTDALLIALRARDVTTVEMLMRAHSGSPRLPGRSQTLLSYAVAWNDVETLKLLLDTGDDPNTVLSAPLDAHFSRLIEAKNIKYYLEADRSMTLLMLAAGLGRTEMVAELLDRGARRGSATARYKMTAVSFAAQRNHVPVMQLLLGKKPGANDTRVEISLSSQRAVLYRHGLPAVTTRVSTGRRGFKTPTGTFVVTDKHRVRRSSLYDVNMPYFMRLSCGEYGMHEGYVPNHPASHGCIRIPRGIARQFYKLVEVGTLVNIMP